MTATASELKRVLQRFRMQSRHATMLTPRYRLRYFHWGPTGQKPVIFIHGMSDRSRSFVLLMAQLIDFGIPCIGYELPNGRDDQAKLAKISHRDLADDLHLFIQHLGYEQVDLLGSSFGTSIALHALSLDSTGVHRCILQGGFARRTLTPLERGLCRVGRHWPWMMSDLPGRMIQMLRLEGRHFSHSPSELWRFLLANNGATPCRAAAFRSLLIDQLDLRCQLGQISTPTLMIGGDDDLIVPQQFELEVLEGLPDVRRVVFAKCGHYPQYTRHEAMAKLINEFLQEPAIPTE